eukprot:CAMPEP_0197828144 /NCGR_PEP_ID=MMETSP1437-20131217/4779_1 /TAXON_ID=49252 ORGANISM="Eucampia antarctica, Strain CCMP1452" /NCGR_SAMPLE_ID=MMETSP1437 /ASSEMBLY_ACC=CAM_ASM_001096 /LENGTH=385 /DNA_ID=CAMNT_0043429267 /DNA_START=27 /DNA_END=1184 /DNA_ORIENTATION=+
MPQPPPPPSAPPNKPPPPQRPPPPSSGGPPPPPSSSSRSPPRSSPTKKTANSNNVRKHNAASSSFSEQDLPSVSKSGMTVAEERLKRRRTCRFLEEGGRILHLPRIPIATAMVLFHRFYAVHSFAEHDRFEVAVACLLLAAKTEESPKKLTSVISECWRLKNRAMRKSTSSGNASPNTDGGTSPLPPTPSGSSNVDKNGYLDTKSEEYLKLKERILLLERVILHTIGFELSIDHPYKFLVEQIQRLMSSRQLEYVSPPAESASTSTASLQSKMTNELVQYAMNFANDSMHTSLCLQFPAKRIAQACVYMSAQYCKMRPCQKGQTWLDLLDNIEMNNLASICLQIMELIADKKGCDLTIFKTIRSDLEKMRNRGPSSVPSPKRPRI